MLTSSSWPTQSGKRKIRCSGFFRCEWGVEHLSSDQLIATLTPSCISFLASSTTSGVRRFKVPSWSRWPLESHKPHVQPWGMPGTGGRSLYAGTRTPATLRVPPAPNDRPGMSKVELCAGAVLLAKVICIGSQLIHGFGPPAVMRNSHGPPKACFRTDEAPRFPAWVIPCG